jgi:hypothetical protein
MTDVAKVLNDAADLIEQRGWTTRANARNAKGFLVAPSSATAVCWCAGGAIHKVASDDQAFSAVHALVRYLGLDYTFDLPDWNDAQPGPEPVIAALRAAAQAVES